MAEQEGFIKIDRNMLQWGWFKNPNTAHLFLTLLLKANYKDMVFDGKAIKVGSLVTSYQTLGEISGLTIQQCRTALKHLKSTGEVTGKSYPKYQVITIVNYKKYQSVTRLLAGNQQATNRQLTGNQQQEKEGKKGRRKEEESLRSGSPSGKKLPDKNEGTYEDIPIEHRDGTYHSFKTYEEFWKWRFQ